MITYQQLNSLQTAPLGSAADDYRAAGAKLRKAGTNYQSHVVAPIDGRHVWRGAGRGHAETVVRVERLAFSTAGARMRTVANCLDTLEAELRASRHALTTAASAARGDGFTVSDEGRVTKDPTLHRSGTNPYSGGIDWTSTYRDQQAAKHQAKIDLQVRRARRADSACRKLLDTVVAATFVTTSTAQPGALDQARDANATARDAETFATLLGDILHAAYADDARDTDDKEYGAIDSALGLFTGFWEAARDTGSFYLGLLTLLGYAAAGDPQAQRTLTSIPASVKRQLSSLDGWKDLIDWEDLEEQRPGEFAGNILFALAIGKIRAPKVHLGHHRTTARGIRAMEDDRDLMQIADYIADHAAHRGHEIPGVPEEHVPEYVFNVMRRSDGTQLPDSPSGAERIAWWDPERDVFIVKNGSRGTVFPPDQGDEYLRELMRGDRG